MIQLWPVVLISMDQMLLRETDCRFLLMGRNRYVLIAIKSSCANLLEEIPSAITLITVFSRV